MNTLTLTIKEEKMGYLQDSLVFGSKTLQLRLLALAAIMLLSASWQNKHISFRSSRTQDVS